MLNNNRKFDYRIFYCSPFEKAAIRYRFLQAWQTNVMILAATAVVAYNYVPVTSYTVAPTWWIVPHFVVNTLRSIL